MTETVTVTQDSTIFIQSTGAQGVPGLGFPPGGTTNQLLAKVSGDDYDAVYTSEPVVEKLEFNQAPVAAPLAAQLQWNQEDGTLDVGLNHGGAVLQVGQEQLYRVVNMTGAIIPSGTPVMAVGTIGNTSKVKVAPWNGLQPSHTVMGLSTVDIPTAAGDENGYGYVTSFGKVRGIQTNGDNYGEAWVDGDILYLGATGGLTKSMPPAPNPKTVMALVINAHVSNGSLLVRVTLGSSLGNDELVTLTGLAAGDILRFDGNRFVNTPLGAHSNADAVTALASAATITPDKYIHTVSGTAPISTITPPADYASTGGVVVLIPTGAWSTTTAGNIALATTAVVGKALFMTYVAATGKWYPSY